MSYETETKDGTDAMSDGVSDTMCTLVVGEKRQEYNYVHKHHVVRIIPEHYDSDCYEVSGKNEDWIPTHERRVEAGLSVPSGESSDDDSDEEEEGEVEEEEEEEEGEEAKKEGEEAKEEEEEAKEEEEANGKEEESTCSNRNDENPNKIDDSSSQHSSTLSISPRRRAPQLPSIVLIRSRRIAQFRWWLNAQPPPLRGALKGGSWKGGKDNRIELPEDDLALWIIAIDFIMMNEFVPAYWTTKDGRPQDDSGWIREWR
ncbi:retrotransposon-like protein 1 [Xylographa pallens]|nr:retrotransposon-like protein 1 [Xylographa pallens]